MPLRIKRDSENIFFRCVEDCSEAIMITDKNNQLLYVNPTWTKIYGYSYEEATSNTPRILRTESQADGFYQRMWADILNPEIGFWRGEIVNRTKEGEKVPVLLTITPFREGGDITGYMGIAVDIREEKKLEEQVMHQDRLASVGMLASGLAHEIGTPLGTIRGRAELLSMTEGTSSSLKSGLKIIITQIDRVSKLIDSLLRIARSKSVVELHNVALMPALEDVCDLIQQKTRKAHIEVKVECRDTLYIRAERSRVDQVLLNLCINAIHAIQEKQKFTPDSTENSLGLFVTENDREVSLEIRDTGCGIARKNRDNLFKPFFTTKDVGEGTGLGLAIVAKIIDEMGANIRVESEVGKGSSFFIDFMK